MAIWLFGDSIFHGAISDQDLEPGDALWPIRAPAQLINLVIGRQKARLGGGTLIPTGVTRAAAALQRRIGTVIRPTDIIVMLDVGRHSEDPDLHEQQWLELRRATENHPGLVLICEGFDNGARGRRHFMHCAAFGTRSHNDAVRAAATAAIQHSGTTRFVATAKPLLRFQDAIKSRFGAEAFRADGIHLNAWGQARLCSVILETIGWHAAPLADRFAMFAQTAWKSLDADNASTAGEIARLAFRADDDIGGPLDDALPAHDDRHAIPDPFRQF